ncbi:Gfo/Idh/MocA family protein [Aquipuribacter hungaricus]|uniref:Gfo/Idh/MocA family protein n=1 Tax=Aquipuribacter hungaricus TaxID=545624 RepID=A0ABV7WG74_9MICO
MRPHGPDSAPPAQVRWGVVGTGPIAARVLGDLALTPGAVLAGVCSRTAAGGAAFAAAHGVGRTYTDPAALAADVDVVYVATPHAAHLDAAAAAMAAGTAVLVEKPLTATLAGARRLVEVAREHDVFCMEAMWTRFLPVTAELLDVAASGEVGRLRALHASIGSLVPPEPGGRLHDPQQGGGALLDIGVYPVWLALLLLGPVSSVAVAGEVSPGGVDVLSGLLLGHEGGAVSLLSSTLSSSAAGDAVLEGSLGAVRLEAPLWAPPALTVLHGAGVSAQPADRTVRPGRRGAGYVHMLEHVQECVLAGLTESPLHPLGTTLAVMEVLEQALDQLGVVRPDEVETAGSRA